MSSTMPSRTTLASGSLVSSIESLRRLRDYLRRQYLREALECAESLTAWRLRWALARAPFPYQTGLRKGFWG